MATCKERAEDMLLEPVIEPTVVHLKWTTPFTEDCICLSAVTVAFIFNLVNPLMQECKMTLEQGPREIAAAGWSVIDEALARAPFAKAGSNAHWVITILWYKAPENVADPQDTLPLFLQAARDSGCNVSVVYEYVFTQTGRAAGAEFLRVDLPEDATSPKAAV